MLHLLAYKENSKYVRVFANRELESVIREVVDPFFLIVSANPELAGKLSGGKVPDWLHPELTKKTFRFLTNSLHAMEGELLEMGRDLHAHGLGIGEINTYYYIWADLLQTWLVGRGEYDMEYWKLKMLSAFVLVAVGPAEELHKPPVVCGYGNGAVCKVRDTVSAGELLERCGEPDPDQLLLLADRELKMADALEEEETLTRPMVEAGLALLLPYARFVEEKREFADIAAFFHSLVAVMDMDPVWMDDRGKRHIRTLMASITDDLGNWRRAVFVERSAEDVHFLDGSLISSCFQLENLLGKEAETEVIGEVSTF